MPLVITVLRAILIAAALTVLTMVDIDVPNETYWDGKRYIVYVSLGAAFLSYVSGGLVQWHFRRREAGAAHEYQRNVQAALAAALVRITTVAQVSWQDVGVHAFRVRGLWWSARLVNVGRVRLGARPTMERPVWKRGKGVVGTAWQRGDFLAVDWADFHARHHARGKAEWRRLDGAARYGMTWLEIDHSRGYGTIMAFPVVDLVTDTVVGCVSVDAPFGAGERQRAEVREVLRELAEAVLRAGDPPVYWFQQRV